MYTPEFREGAVRIVIETGRPIPKVAQVRAERFARADFRGCAFINTMAETADTHSSAYRVPTEHKERVTAYVAGLLAKNGHEDAEALARRFVLLMDGAPSDEISAAIGADVLSVHETGPDVGEPLVEVADEKTVRALAPDLAAVAALPCRGGLIVTARADDRAAGYDFVSRCFFPGIGIDEDPVTGGAHTALAPFWSARLGSTTLTGLQASARSGLVRTELRGERTLLHGSAVTVIDGELLTTP